MICALLLAAGRSRRMGTQKLLLPFGGSTVVGRIVDELLASPVDDVAVVTGTDSPAIRQALEGRGVRFVFNPETEAEMLSSVRCGLKALPKECDAVLLALGDQPGIRRELVGQLVDAMQSSGRSIVVPFHNGHRAHPFLFSVQYRDQILQGYDDTGMRGFLDTHEQETLKIDIDEGWTLQDMDYPEDYLRALNHGTTESPQ